MGQALITDAMDILIASRGRSKTFFADYVCKNSRLPRETVIEAHQKYRLRAFTDADYHYTDAIRDAMEELGVSHLYDDYFGQRDAYLQEVELKPGVREALEKLSERGVPVYVLTDFDEPAEVMERLFETLGIGHLVNKVFSSKDIGYMKPAKEAFAYVTARCGLPREETPFLGHSYDEVRGAHSLGYPVITCFENGGEDFSFVPQERRLGKNLEGVVDLFE